MFEIEIIYFIKFGIILESILLDNESIDMLCNQRKSIENIKLNSKSLVMGNPREITPF